jgi:hypothetical protein
MVLFFRQTIILIFRSVAIILIFRNVTRCQIDSCIEIANNLFFLENH